MSDNRLHEHQHEDPLGAPLWDPESDDRCIVCSRPSNGKAICGDARCADELARS